MSTWDTPRFEIPVGRREWPQQNMGSKQKPFAESYQNPSKGSTQAQLPGAVTGQWNTRKLATSGIFGSCSRTYCLSNGVFKVSKNELKMSVVFHAKARDLKQVCCLLKYHRPKLLSIIKEKTGIILWTPAWEYYLVQNLWLEICTSFTWIKKK